MNLTGNTPPNTMPTNMNNCKMCNSRGKDWHGDDPKCAFIGLFSDNWNCATLNAVRNICNESQNPLPDGVQYTYCDDSKYATIKIDDLEIDGEQIGMALWVAWYKSRGKTDAVWILDSDLPPRIPTERELLEIIAAYRK